jgi:omega-amidase
MQDLKVAIVQTQQFWENKAKNLVYFEKNYLSKMKAEEADLILLPEMFNTGFSMNAKELAEVMSGSSIQWLIKWADKLKCQIGASLIVEDEGNFYNRFLIVSGDGVETHYDKRHLFRMANENDHFTAGAERVIYNLNGWKIMLQVCYDLRFPVFSRCKTIDGMKEYDVVIYIANWPEKRNSVWKTLLKARAIENQAYCIGVNRVGIDGNQISYTGDSAVIDPWGNTQYQFTEGEENVKVLTLKYGVIEEITERFPAFKDADQ